MKTKTVNLYLFNELTEDLKSKVLENYYDINVDYDWWESTYEDAENIGLKITGFDTGRANYCNGEFTLSAYEVAANIIRDHGQKCETYKTAFSFMQQWQPIFNEYMNEDSEHYESAEYEEKMNDTENDFLNSLLKDYLIILRNEYEYLTSEDAIKETLICNDYYFNERGKIDH
jgi:hypothetical protein